MSRKRLLLALFLVAGLVIGGLVVDARNPCRVERPILPETWFSAPTQPAPTCGYRVVADYPHDPAAFIQGLQWVGGEFIEGTGLVGRSSLRRVDPTTGMVIQQINLDPQVFGEGVVVVGERIYQLTWQNHIGYVYDRASFRLLQTWEYATEGWGLTYNGENLVMSDGTATLYFVDPDTLVTVGQVVVTDGGTPVARLNELEYIDGIVFANIWQTNTIVRIDPASGQVLARIDFTGLLPETQRAGADVLNGIAYAPNGRRLFVTGKLWPSLFEVEVTDPTR